MTPAPSTLAAAALAERFRESGCRAVVRNSRVEADGHTIEIATTPATEGKKSGLQFVGLRFELSFDGRPAPALATDSVGAHRRYDAAVRDAVESWSHFAGLALARALTSGSHTPTGYVIAMGRVGLIGVQRHHPGFESVQRSLAGILEHYGRALVEWRPDYHSLSISLTVEGEEVTGSCRMDGYDSAELLNSVLALAWPSGRPDYMFRLFAIAAPH